MSELQESEEALGNETSLGVDRLFWSDDDARVVADFLAGNYIQTTQDEETQVELWGKVKAKISVKNEREIDNLLTRARGLKPMPYKKIYPPENGKSEENLNEEEYKLLAKLAAKTALQIVEPALRKSGIWGPNDNTRIQVSAGFRNKTNFAVDTITQDDPKQRLRYYSPEEGGPDLIGIIRAPEYSLINNPNESRFRKSLAHEIGHVVRALTNKFLWRGFEEKAKEFGLRSTDPQKELYKSRVIGGYYVGSNLVGSESVGELFSVLAKLEASGEVVTIEDTLSALNPQLKADIEKLENLKESHKDTYESSSTRYAAARIGLYDHLLQLKELGLENADASKLLALGTLGFSSFEKLPQLIKLGVVNWDKYSKMKVVVRTILEWLSGKQETIKI